MNFRFSIFDFRIALAALLGLASVAQGRTITIDATAVDAMAMISEDAPRLSWAGYEAAPGIYSPEQVHLSPGRALLVRYDFVAIPEGMRIVHAEWIVPVEAVTPREARIYVWRMSAEWGPGVSHLYRMVGGEALPWAVAGGRGPGVDRGARPSAVVRTTGNEELAINVTEEVSLWHGGSVPNHGWMITVEDVGSTVRLGAPIWRARDTWRLRVTYEPG